MISCIIPKELTRTRVSHSKTLYPYPKPGIKVLHSLQGQLLGVQDLMRFLNSLRLLHDFSSSESIVFHTIGPKLLKDCSPL